jgi:hypothetical protein
VRTQQRCRATTGTNWLLLEALIVLVAVVGLTVGRFSRGRINA